MRSDAAAALAKLVGEGDPGFDPGAAIGDRAAKVAAWKTWWRDNREAWEAAGRDGGR